MKLSKVALLALLLMIAVPYQGYAVMPMRVVPAPITRRWTEHPIPNWAW